MLQKPDVNVSKIMELADFIGGLEPDRFSMKSWGTQGEPRCICGWLLHNEGVIEKDNVAMAAQLLGIPETTAHALFSPPRGSAKTDWTPTEAAATLRHLATTGELA